MSLESKLNWAFIFICLAERPLGTIMTTSLANVRLLLMIVALIYNLKNPNFRKSLFKGSICIWGVWTIYSIINWYICPHKELPFSDYLYIGIFVRSFALLSILYFEALTDYQRSLKFLMYIFIGYFMLGILGQGSGPIKESASWEGRNGTLLGNSFPLAMMCSLFIFFIAKLENLITSRQLLVVILCVVLVILWVATRKALFGVAILCFFYVLSCVDLSDRSNLGYLLLSVLGIYFVYHLIMKYTLLGSRVEQLNDFEYAFEVPSYLQFLGDRAIQYVLAWEVFLQHPINGVGLGNSMDYTGLPIPLHTEYMEHLCEGGCIGFFLFLLFVFKISQSIYTAYTSENDKKNIILAGGLLMLLFIGMTTWLYNIPVYFIVYAMIIAKCDLIKDNYSDYVDKRTFGNNAQLLFR